MDQLDEAKALEQVDRERALATQKSTRLKEPPQWVEGGEVLCLECALPIEPARLEIKPDAARCTECQNIYEIGKRYDY